MEVEINDLTSVGCVRDVEGHALPPEAWTFADNMRYSDLGVERIGGQQQVFGTPGVAPIFTLPINGSAQTYWLYTSLSKAYVYDGTTHTNITRQTAAVDVNYSTTFTREWSGTLLANIPILNNGIDPPQYWSTLNPSTKLTTLANWPANTFAKHIRSFGPFLLALNVTKSGTNYPHMVKWSHPAAPGTVPTSWDPLDETLDAGENDLPDASAGVILDGLGLKENFFVYKEGSIWRMNLVGGQSIFNFDKFLETAGIMTQRCVAITGDGTRHVFASQDDILVHDGNNVNSILDNRYKRFLRNVIDGTNYLNCFMFTNPQTDEVYFCYPENGQVDPNRALIWNYKNGKQGAISECDINFVNAAAGVVENASTATWATVGGTWASTALLWSQNERRQLVGCDPTRTQFIALNSGTNNDGVDFTGTLQRDGLGIVGRKRTGEWIVDFTNAILLRRVWIKATGGPINVRVGFQDTPEGPIRWNSVVSFDPDEKKWIDTVGSGVAVAIEFSADVPFRIIGYKPEFEVLGRY